MIPLRLNPIDLFAVVVALLKLKDNVIYIVNSCPRLSMASSHLEKNYESCLGWFKIVKDRCFKYSRIVSKMG